MTREEAKNMRLFTQWQEERETVDWNCNVLEILSDHDKIIDKIYDDFESINCSNCKHWKIAPTPVNKYANICTMWANNVYTENNFCCNKWEGNND